MKSLHPQRVHKQFELRAKTYGKLWAGWATVDQKLPSIAMIALNAAPLTLLSSTWQVQVGNALFFFFFLIGAVATSSPRISRAELAQWVSGLVLCLENMEGCIETGLLVFLNQLILAEWAPLVGHAIWLRCLCAPASFLALLLSILSDNTVNHQKMILCTPTPPAYYSLAHYVVFPLLSDIWTSPSRS